MSRACAVPLAVALACAAPEEPPLPRILAVAPSGRDVATTAAATVRFSVAVDPAGLLDARRIVLAEAGELDGAVAAVESEAGASGAGIPVRVTLGEGGTVLTLTPAGALRGHAGHAVVVSSRLRAADGRRVLDPEGRRRTFVARFETGAGEGPPPVPALTEARADAETPEAGGEYVEVANLGDGPLDLRGWRLGKRTSSGALGWCTIEGAAADALRPGGVALLAGGAWDGRYRLPPGVPVLRCGATGLAGGLANDRPVDLVLADPIGAVAATLGEAGAPRCPVAVERVAAEAADVLDNLVCTGGSPGEL